MLMTKREIKILRCLKKTKHAITILMCTVKKIWVQSSCLNLKKKKNPVNVVEYYIYILVEMRLL